MKPIFPNTPSRFTQRKTSRTNLTYLKPAEYFFFSFLLCPGIPSSFLSFCLFSFLLPSILYLFYSFFLPSFIYSFVLIFVKIPSYLDSNLSLFLLASFLSFPIPFFPPSLLFLSFNPLSLFPTDETKKPGVMKRPELDCVIPTNVSSRGVSTGD